MPNTSYKDIRDVLIRLYLDDDRPWLVGFSGGKDSTMVASLIFDAVLFVPAIQRKKQVVILCTDTRVEIPAISEMVEGTLTRTTIMGKRLGSNPNIKGVYYLAELFFPKKRPGEADHP